MGKLLLILAVIINAAMLEAQVTFSPSSCEQTMIQYGPYPPPCEFTMSGSGTVTLQRPALFPGWHWWDAAGNDILSMAVSGGEKLYLSCYYCNNMGVGTHTPDIQPAKIDATTVPATLIVEPAFPTFYSTHNRKTNTALSTCSPSGTIWRGTKDDCTLSSEALGAYTPPAVGASYNDQVFGTPIAMLAKVWHDAPVVNAFNIAGGVDRYVTTTNNCSDDIGNSFTSQVGIYSLTKKTKVYNAPCDTFGISGGLQFSHTDPAKVYLQGLTGTRQYRLVAASAPALTSDGLIYTPPDGNSTDAGGSPILTEEDWFATYEFSSSTATVASGTITTAGSLINLATGKVIRMTDCSDNGLNRPFVITSVTSPTVFAISSGLSATGCNIQLWDKIAVIDLKNQTTVLRVNFETTPNQPLRMRGIQISPKDRLTGRYYIVQFQDYPYLGQLRANAVSSFLPGDTSLTHEYTGPLTRGTPNTGDLACNSTLASQERCMVAAHASMIRLGASSYLTHQTNMQEGGGEDFIAAIIGYRLSGGTQSYKSSLLGGGTAWWNKAVDHITASRLGPFIASNGDASQGGGAGSSIASVRITSYSGAEATTNVNHGFIVGDNVIFSVPDQSTTDAGLNGTRTVATVPAANRFTTSYTPSSYQANSTLVYKTQNMNEISNGYNEIFVSRLDSAARMMQVRRVAKHLSAVFQNSSITGDGYRDQPHVILSPDGKYVGWTSNLLRGNRDYLYVAETGFDGNLEDNQFTSTTRITAEPSATSVLFHATLPEVNQNYTIDISTSLGIGTPVVSSTVSGVTLANLGANVTGLTANTLYRYVAYSADHYYVATGTFKTFPTPAGTASVSFRGRAPAGATTVQVNSGATSGLGTLSSSVPCTAGSQCEVFVSGSVGNLLYGRLEYDTGHKTSITSRIIK